MPISRLIQAQPWSGNYLTKPTHNAPKLIDSARQKAFFYDHGADFWTKTNPIVTRQPIATWLMATWLMATLFAINGVFLFTATLHMSDTDTSWPATPNTCQLLMTNF
jgi:hypothetical protein|tara:strand:- start:211 stop:531 length:321 start_codon:yes stop_codon:yes gene_type:complete